MRRGLASERGGKFTAAKPGTSWRGPGTELVEGTSHSTASRVFQTLTRSTGIQPSTVLRGESGSRPMSNSGAEPSKT